jgi:hypothetical protein
MNLANRVRAALMGKYGCVLGEGRVVSGELAVEDPVASLFGRYFTVRTPRRKIDHSWNVGELGPKRSCDAIHIVLIRIAGG